MECVPDLSFFQQMAVNNSEMLSKIMWGNANGASSNQVKQRKTNFTTREVESLLQAVSDRKDTVLWGVAGGAGWARAWHEVAEFVSAVEGIHRSESDVRKKWTYLKWEAKNTSKPGRDPTSRAVLDILTTREGQKAAQQAAANSLLEQLLVPGQQSGSPQHSGSTSQTGSPNPNQHSTTPQTTPAAASQHHNVQSSTSAPSPSTPSITTPSSPEVCLRWNSYHSNMQSTFPNLLSNEQFVDVTLACEGRSIKCHKVILSSCSTYFEDLLSQNPCQHPIVLMRDFKFWEIQALVEFMYSGEVNVAQDKLPFLLAAAEALQIKGLHNPSQSAGNSTSSLMDESSSNADIEDSSCPIPTKKNRKRKATTPVPNMNNSKHNNSHLSSSHTTPVNISPQIMLPKSPALQKVNLMKQQTSQSSQQKSSKNAQLSPTRNKTSPSNNLPNIVSSTTPIHQQNCMKEPPQLHPIQSKNSENSESPKLVIKEEKESPDDLNIKSENEDDNSDSGHDYGYDHNYDQDSPYDNGSQTMVVEEDDMYSGDSDDQNFETQDNTE